MDTSSISALLLAEGVEGVLLLETHQLAGNIKVADGVVTVTGAESACCALAEVHAIGLFRPVTCIAAGSPVALKLRRGNVVSGKICYLDNRDPFVLLNEASFEDAMPEPKPLRRRRDDHLGPLTEAEFELACPALANEPDTHVLKRCVSALVVVRNVVLSPEQQRLVSLN